MLGFKSRTDDVVASSLIPTLIPQFTGSNIMTRASHITCGPSCEFKTCLSQAQLQLTQKSSASVVIDRQKMFQVGQAVDHTDGDQLLILLDE